MIFHSNCGNKTRIKCAVLRWCSFDCAFLPYTLLTRTQESAAYRVRYENTHKLNGKFEQEIVSLRKDYREAQEQLNPLKVCCSLLQLIHFLEMFNVVHMYTCSN